MRMNKSLAVVSSDWDDFGEKKSKKVIMDNNYKKYSYKT